MAASVFLPGCGKASSTTFRNVTPGQGNLSKEDLRQAINDFEDKAVTLIRTSGEELNRSVLPDNVKKISLIRRIRIIQAFHTMAGVEEPTTAYIELWTLCARFRAYVDDNPDSEFLGTERSAAVATARELENDIEVIGRQFLSPEAFETTKKQVQTFAQTHPVNKSFSNIAVFATQTKPGEKSPFQNILSLPMAPFRAIEGVDRGASAIYSLSDSADRISDIVEQLPESAKWQALLFVMEAEDTEMARTVLANMTQMSQSSAKIADAADTLPARMRQEASTLISEIDSKQANLQATLAKTETTAAALEKTLAQADKTIAALNETAHNFNETSKSWEAAATATGSTVTIIRDWANQPAVESNEPPFNINDYKDLAIEVRATLAEAKSILGQDGNGGVVGDIDKRLSSQVNGIALRLAGLVLLAFVMALAYKRITSSWKPRK